MTLQARNDTLITIFGGAGFLGRHVVRALAKRHYQIRVAVRRPELDVHLQPLGRVGQIHTVQANLRHPGSVAAAVRDADVVVNLVGILYERGRQRFDAVQTAGAEAVALAAAQHGARLVHMSALGADEKATSAYARSKAAGEKAVRAAVPDATIYDHLGDIYATLEDVDKARDAWRKSLAVERNEQVQKKLEPPKTE